MTDACTEFTGWSGGGCSGNAACVVTLQSDTAIVANFAAIDVDSDQIPDCSDPDIDNPDDSQDNANTGDENGSQEATAGSSGGSGGGCFIHSLR